MKKFISITSTKGKNFLININHIINVIEGRNNGSMIVLSHGVSPIITGLTLDEIEYLITN